MKISADNIEAGRVRFERYIRTVATIHEPSEDDSTDFDQLADLAYWSLRSVLSIAGCSTSRISKNKIDIPEGSLEYIGAVHHLAYSTKYMRGIIDLVQPNPLVDPRMPSIMGRPSSVSAQFLMDGLSISPIFTQQAEAHDRLARARRVGTQLKAI